MEIESEGDEVEVVVVEHDRAENVGERGRLNTVRVELGLGGGNDQSSTRVSGVRG
jgi:hypothetical protein